MTKTTHTLIPKLRFPEFTGEWDRRRLGNDILEYKGGAPLTPADFVLFSEFEVIPKKGILSGGKLILDIEQPTYCSEQFFRNYSNSVVDSSFLITTLRDLVPAGPNIGYIVKNLSNKRFMLAQGVYGLKVNTDKLCEEFLIQYSNTKLYRTLMQKIMVGSTQVHIRNNVFLDIELNVPNPPEQQKIASCLSSLDEVIVAQSQKLELLKDHKKGLMQNLFPQDGEKVPKYRFKEFVNDGEWVVKKLGEIGEPLMCKRIFKEETTSNAANGIPFYKIGTFGRVADSFISIELYNEYKSKFSFPKVGDILVSAAGTIGRLVVYDGFPAYFQDSNIVWLGNSEALVLNSFLFHCYSRIKWQTSDGGIISRLYNSDLKNMKILFPKGKTEQEKLAKCLSSLDDLITAQAEKIELLKLYKKGLMQGLFPNLSE